MERFLEYFEPERYDLNLFINKDKRLIRGSVAVRGVALAETIKLHAVKMQIEQVMVAEMVEEGHGRTRLVDFEHKDGVLSLVGVGQGEVRFEVYFNFELTEDMQGTYLSKYMYEGHEETMVVTQFESHYARECFPCVDEPAAKAVFGLTILVPDAEAVVVANMPVASEWDEYAEDEDHELTDEFLHRQVVFEDTPRMSTYLLAFSVGRFRKLEAESAKGVKVTTYAGLNQPVAALKYASDFAVRCVDFYSNLFATPYPLPKLDQVAVPDFEAGAMENWGLMTFREQALLCDEGSALDQKLYVATVIAHEISHMWFGDLVTMRWWDDLWLNESFASLMETYAVDKLAPELKPWDDFYMGTVVPALRRDCLPGVQPVKVDVANVEDIANLFDGAIVYAKGARLMLMLMRLMGEKSFFNGLKEYFAKHAYGNTVADDLWESLTPYADFDVREFMTPWLTQPGYPVLTGGEQKRFLIAGSDENYEYPVPVVMDDLAGHYILNLDEAEFGGALDEFGQKGLEQKLRLLLDRGLLAKTPLVASVSLLPLVEKFVGETDYVIWDAVNILIADLKVFVEYGTETEMQFKRFVGGLAEAAYRRLGDAAKDGETDNDVRLRAIILGLKCYAEEPDFVAEIANRYGDVALEAIDANVRSVVLTVLLRNNEGLARGYLEAYLKTTDPELKSDLMAALTATRNNEIAADYLEKLRNGTIKAQDRLYFFARLARNQAVKAQALDWMYENWDWLVKSEGDKTISDYPRFVAGVIRDEDEAAQYRSFFESRLGEVILARNISVGLVEIESRLALIASDGSEIKDFLKNL